MILIGILRKNLGNPVLTALACALACTTLMLLLPDTAIAAQTSGTIANVSEMTNVVDKILGFLTGAFGKGIATLAIVALVFLMLIV